MTRLEHPVSLDDALARLAGGDAQPIGGGVGVLLRIRLGGAAGERFVAVRRVSDLRRIEVEASSGNLLIGAAATLAEVAASPAVREVAPLLAAAAAAAASPAIRTIGTLGGNLVDAPAGSDLVAAAIALDARLEIRTTRGARLVPIRALVAERGPALEPGELVAAVRVPSAAAGWALERLQTQGRGDRPAVTVAVRVVADSGTIVDLRAAATFLADRPLDLAELHGAATGAAVGALAAGQLDAAVGAAALAAVDRALAEGVVLVDDLRASASYRREMVAVLARRAATAAARRLTR